MGPNNAIVVQPGKDESTESALIESLVVAGDISRLGQKERAWYYRRRCADLLLDVASKPFDVLRLNGKEVLYLNKSGTDQLARIHRVTRRIVEGPCLKVVEGTKLAYAKCEASTPDGRTEECVATLPWGDAAMILMKVETKAKRRATIAITGAGALDESEIEDIPATAKSPGRPLNIGELTPGDEFEVEASEAAGHREVPPVLAKVRDAIAEVGGQEPSLTAEQAAAIWGDHYAEIVAGGLQERAGEMLELALGPKLKTRFKVLLREHESKVAAAKREAHEKAVLDELTAKICAAKTVAELAAAKEALTKEQSGALAGPMWVRRIELCATVAELARLLPAMRESIKNSQLRERVLAAASRRQRELEGRGPDDGGPDGGERAPATSQAESDEDPEREAIIAEGRGSESSQALAAAVGRLRHTNGPTHAVSHYLAHRDELPRDAQAAYREALLDWLPRRYPEAVGTRARAEAELAEAEAGSERKAAA